MKDKRMTNLSCSCGALQVSCCPDLSEEEVFLMKIILTLLERQAQIALFFLLNSYFARPFPNSGPSWFLPPARNSCKKVPGEYLQQSSEEKKWPPSGICIIDFYLPNFTFLNWIHLTSNGTIKICSKFFKLFAFSDKTCEF